MRVQGTSVSYYNAKAGNKAANRPAGAHSNNFADQIYQAGQMQYTSKFIQQVTQRANKIPFIILYTADQLAFAKKDRKVIVGSCLRAEWCPYVRDPSS